MAGELCLRCAETEAAAEQIGVLDEVVPFAGADAPGTDGVFPVAQVEDSALLGSGAEAFDELRTIVAESRCEIRLLPGAFD